MSSIKSIYTFSHYSLGFDEIGIGSLKIRSCEEHFILVQHKTYEGVTKSFWTGHLEQELQMVQLSATRCSCNAIL
jgi:hypothetical protein